MYLRNYYREKLLMYKNGGDNLKTIKKSELRELVKTKSLREIAKIYGISYERTRQICIKWGIARRGWKRVRLIDDEKK